MSSSPYVTPQDIGAARTRISSFVSPTPLEYSARLSRQYGADIYLKREDLTTVRSYKIRGAGNCISSLSEEEKKRGVVCASAGNHAQGVAFTCASLGIKGTIFMPRLTPEQKVYKTRKFGGKFIEIILTGETFDDASTEAKRFMEETGAVFIHPFDDDRTIAGQGTIGAEIIEQCPVRPDFILGPIGGGGLISGLISAMEYLSPETRVIGVEPSGAASMKTSLQNNTNTTLSTLDTFADGAAVKRVGDRNFQISAHYGLEVLSVPENRICTNMLECLREEGIVTEPAGALAISAVRDVAYRITGKTVVLIVSGGNFDFERLPEVKERSMRQEGRKRYLIVNFPQRPGVLKEFIALLGPRDDITRFEYLKKGAKSQAPALVGIETDDGANFTPLFAAIERAGITYRDITEDQLFFDLII